MEIIKAERIVVERDLDNLIELLESAKADAMECDTGNIAAGIRLRKVLMQVKRECHVFRKRASLRMKGRSYQLR